MFGFYCFFLVSLFATLINCASQPKWVCRADSRSFAQIKADSGFLTKADTNHKKPDYSLYTHLKLDGGRITAENDGYVSTSSDFKICEGWIHKYLGGKGYVYKISADHHFVDVPGTMLEYDKYKEEEFAAKDKIPWSMIDSWVPYINGKAGPKVLNRDFSEKTHHDVAGGAQYKLAGFPPGHKAWTKSPWKEFAPKSSSSHSSSHSGHSSSSSGSKSSSSGSKSSSSGSKKSSGSSSSGLAGHIIKHWRKRMADNGRRGLAPSLQARAVMNARREATAA